MGNFPHLHWYVVKWPSPTWYFYSTTLILMSQGTQWKMSIRWSVYLLHECVSSIWQRCCTHENQISHYFKSRSGSQEDIIRTLSVFYILFFVSYFSFMWNLITPLSQIISLWSVLTQELTSSLRNWALDSISTFSAHSLIPSWICEQCLSQAKEWEAILIHSSGIKAAPYIYKCFLFLD